MQSLLLATCLLLPTADVPAKTPTATPVKRILFVVSQAGCIPCRDLERRLEALRAAGKIPADVTVANVNMDVPPGAAFLDQAIGTPIAGTPQMVLTGKGTTVKGAISDEQVLAFCAAAPACCPSGGCAPQTGVKTDDIPWLPETPTCRDRISGAVYERITLGCGCPLTVLDPKSYGCLGDPLVGYPDLAKAVAEVYRLAKLHAEDAAEQPKPKKKLSFL